MINQLNRDISNVCSGIKIIKENDHNEYEIVIDDITTVNDLKRVSKSLTGIYQIYNFEFVVSVEKLLLKFSEF